MILPSHYTVVLDSSVLFPVFISNLLLFLSESELFRVRWSPDIHQEWIESRLERYPDADRRALERKRDRMDLEFPDALVTGYENLIDLFELDDLDDRHVVAAAVHCKANVIVTDNPGDFPLDRIPGTLLIQTADEFIVDQFDLTSNSAWQVALALIRHKTSLSKSRPTWKRYFQTFSNRLPQSFAIVNGKPFREILFRALRSRDWDY